MFHSVISTLHELLPCSLSYLRLYNIFKEQEITIAKNKAEAAHFCNQLLI